MAQRIRRQKAAEENRERQESDEPDLPGSFRSSADARLRLLAGGWFALAGIALLYLATFPFFPSSDVDEAMIPAAKAVSAVDNSTIAKTTVRGFLGTARKQARGVTLGDLTSELSDLRETIAELQSRNAALAADIDALNEAIRSATGALPAKTSSRGTPLPSRGPTGISTVVQPMPGDGFADDRPANTPVPMASVAAPSKTLFAVELSTGENVEALTAAWRILGERHAALLNGLEARRAKKTEKGGSASKWRLVAGPFANAAKAASLCARLRAQQTKCAETVFTGEPL